MPARVINITIDCDDALKVGNFWSAALGRPLDLGSGADFASVGGDDAERSEPAWYFARVPEQEVTKNRMHVDLVDSDLSAIDWLLWGDR